ncbi:MAG: molybdopterin-binding protein [Rhizobiaceae bacterium]|nr:molybdopterin-binding protein [Rhizobiaceae bacterium]
MNKNQITAAMVAIGDELLSGRTQDRNIAYLAAFLNIKGIELHEVRIVADNHEDIIAAVNNLRNRYNYVFTSGGIGPTHDDITTDAIGAAFELQVDYHPVAFPLLETHYKQRKMEFTPARQKMARTPVGADLIDNCVSVAPGFRVENVYVMAGVPDIFKAMVLSIEPELNGGEILLSANIDCSYGEGTIGDPLAAIAKKHKDSSIGSYPRFDGNRYSTQIVVRARSQEALDAAVSDIETMLVHQRSL